jgi:reverse gyrase
MKNTKSDYPYIITYQYFTKNWLGIEKCHFDFVRGKTIDAAEAALNERRRTHTNLQVLHCSEESEAFVDR